MQRLIDFLSACGSFVAGNWPSLLVCAFGLAAIYMLLPRPRRMPVMGGVGCGVLALLLAGVLLVRSNALTIESFLFYVFSATALVAGALLVTQQNPARAALSFALVILASCGLFLLQAAPFLMAATIVVYAGAIIVTFLFVLMLAQQQGLSDADARSREPFLAAFTGFLLLATLLFVLKTSYKPDLASWVRKTEKQRAEVKQLLDTKGDLETSQVIDLGARLRRFTEDYGGWWKNNQGRYPSGADNNLAAALENLNVQLGLLPQKKGESLGAGELASRLEVIEQGLGKLRDRGIETYNNPLLGHRRPVARDKDNYDPGGSDERSFLSEMSGPRASRKVSDLRRDEWGRPKLPAENVSYLGRSLFSDYLLSVELAGMLLLVATIGAIAIASRRPSTVPASGASRPTSMTMPDGPTGTAHGGTL